MDSYFCDKDGYVVVGSDSYGYVVCRDKQLVRAALPIYLVEHDDNDNPYLLYFEEEKSFTYERTTSDTNVNSYPLLGQGNDFPKIQKTSDEIKFNSDANNWAKSFLSLTTVHIWQNSIEKLSSPINFQKRQTLLKKQYPRKTIIIKKSYFIELGTN